MPLGYNRVIGAEGKVSAVRPHRVGIAHWPVRMADPRTRTFDVLLGHVASSGYEGVEFGLKDLVDYFPGHAQHVVAGKIHQAVEAAGLQFFGSTLHYQDAEARGRQWRVRLADQFKLVQDMGGAYVSVQFFLHQDYINTGGAYRGDEEYLGWCADRVVDMRQAAWDLGMNFYLEVHCDRITEDPEACCRLLDLAPCELNGDMSHYLARGFLKGRQVERVLDHIGHTHVRMARVLGDLSAVVEDPALDWQQEGVTWQMFQFMMRALDGGLSSRAVIGETGQMHLVKDTLTQDAALVPLYRAMARYADASAAGITMKITTPADLKPWG